MVLPQTMKPLGNCWKQNIPEARPLPLAPATHSTPVTLESDLNIFSILLSFPKDTAAGPSGLRVQHLIDLPSYTYVLLPSACGEHLRNR